MQKEARSILDRLIELTSDPTKPEDELDRKVPIDFIVSINLLKV